MLSGRAVTLHQRSDFGERLLEYATSGTGEGEEAEAAAAKVLYRPSFEELMPNYLQYDTILWAVICLMLVLAWSAHASLPAVQEICAEEGPLVPQTLSLRMRYCTSLYTFRVESIAHGKPAPLDELQFHGVHSPELIRKVITREASRRIQEVQSWRPRMRTEEDPLDVAPISRIQPPSASVQVKNTMPDVLLLHKLEKGSQSVKNLESLLIGSHSRG